MNSWIRPRNALPIVFAFLLMASVASAQGNGLVPFKGHFSGSGIPVATVSGHATMLGNFTGTANVLVIGPTGFSGIFMWIAPNGDGIFGTIDVTLTGAIGPGVFSFAETAAITGGTGRFAGATGPATATGSINMITSAFAGTFNGTMSSVGSLH